MATTFDYSVRDRTGRLVSGTLDADSPTAVAQRLKQMGYAPVSISEAAGAGGLKTEIRIPGFSGRQKRVKLKDLAVFSRQFATMINSGLSLLRALNILTEQTESKRLAETLTEVRNDVETGSSLSTAMGRHPEVFPPLMVNMCRAGEVGGFLDSVLLQIAENYESEVKLRSKIKAAMTYPVAVLCIAVLAVIGMLIFIVPVFAKMFTTLGGTLPAPTRVLIFLSHAMKWLAPLGLVALIAGYQVWKRIRRKEQVRRVVDPLKLKLPVFGELFRKLAVARFTRNLGTMMHSGVPILQSLEIVADTTGNIVVTDAVRDIQNSVRSGEAITKPLSEHKVFPPMVVQMMAVGEETGALDEMLDKIADFYDQEVEATVNALTSLIEPILIVIMGIVIGGMIIALYLPMFDVIKLIK
jgi:type IV pilus assembly protein PilC